MPFTYDLDPYLLAHPDAKLSDAGLPFVLGDASVDAAGSPGFQAGVKLKLALFNDPRDLSLASGDDDPIALDPKTFGASKVLVRMSLASSVGATYSADVTTWFGGSCGASASLTLYDYRWLDAGETVLNLLPRLAQPKVAFSSQSLQAMVVGDTVALVAPGSVKLGLTLNASDLLTACAWTFAAFPGLALKLSPSLTLKLNAEVTADHALIATREGDDAWRFRVKKARTSSLQGNLAAGLDVTPGVTLPPEILALQSQLDEWLVSAKGFRTKLDQQATGTLTPLELALLGRMLGWIGISLTDLQERRDEALKQLSSLIQAASQQVGTWEHGLANALNSHVKLALTYDFNRLDESHTLVEGVASFAAIPAVLSHLRAGDIDPLVAGGLAGWSLVSYLYQDTLKIGSTTGFSLNIGTWFKVLSTQERKQVLSTTAKADAQHPKAYQLSFTGVLHYNAEFGPENYHFGADLTAATPDFQGLADPPLGALAFGFYLFLEEGHRGSLTHDQKVQMLDCARLWGLGGPELEGPPKPGVSDLKLQLRIDAKAFQPLFASLAADGDAMAPWGEALAAALPWVDMQGRRTWMERGQCYGPAMVQVLLQRTKVNLGQAVLVANSIPVGVPNRSELFNREDRYKHSNKCFFGDMMGTLLLNAQTPFAVMAFQEALKGWADPTRTTKDLPDLETKFRDMYSNAYWVRALGYLLTRRAAALQLPVQCSLQITEGDRVTVVTD